MEKPFIIIDGQKVTPKPPKMKVWREFMKYASEDRSEDSMDEFLESHVKLIILAFGNPDVVNMHTIDEYMEISEIVPMVRKLFTWIQSVTFERLAEVPNSETGTA